MTSTKHHLADHQVHAWDHRGYCEDCGAPQPDYEPCDDAMPQLAAVTDPVKIGDLVNHDLHPGVFRVLTRSPYLVRVRDLTTYALMSDTPEHFTEIN